jgi:TolB-like protein/DNA-binding winged helix-turn-helix (wHTH) protein/Tfp pilus assembly protein PilF
MSGLRSADILVFEGFRLDRRGGALSRLDPAAGVATHVPIGSRALDLLGLLVERPGELVSKDAIMDAVWPGMAVEEGNLTVQVSALRRILDQNRDTGSCIHTVPGRGYRFVAPVARIDAPALPPPRPPSGNGSEGLVAEIAKSPLPEIPVAPGPRDRYRNWRPVAVTAIAALGLLASVVAIWHWRSSGFGEPRLVPPRLSIVVLPFTNLSDDGKQDYFADGITDDLTTDLSRITGMFVISRNTALTYRNKSIDTKQIGRELGVRYLLEGSVRRSGNQVRVNAQLIDAENSAHLWAERFDRDTGDVFALQNEITSQIAIALNLQLIGVEAARPAVRPDALDYILRARAALLKPPRPESYVETISLFERALELDPGSSEAQSMLSAVLVSRVIEGMTNSPEADIARAEELAEKALAISPGSFFPHFARALVSRTQGRCEDAIPEYETAIALNRNWANAIAALGMCKVFTGAIEEALPLLEQAIRLSPRDAYSALWYNWIGRVHLLQSHTDEALLWFERARRANPALLYVHSYLASVYALKGKTERATAEANEVRRLSTDGRYSSIARLVAAEYFGAPKVRALFETTYIAGLRKAGIPEE